MAIRQADLEARDAVIYRFPLEAVHARRARAAMLRRRRTTLGVVALLTALALLAAGGPSDHVLEGPDRPVVTQKIPR